jgi:TRAP-type C4-dicarboxylate transport system permease small subunit
MRIPYKFLYSIVPISGIFIVVARVLKYAQYFTGKKGEKTE